MSFEASVVINTEYSKLQREGAEHILLSNKGRNLCVSVCICIMSRTVHRINFMHGGVLLRTQGSAVSHFGAIWTRDMFRMNNILINYRAWAYISRTYKLRERTLH